MGIFVMKLMQLSDKVYISYKTHPEKNSFLNCTQQFYMFEVPPNFCDN